MPVDIDGPHGIAISPDKQFYYVSLAHGRPFGSVWKYSTKDDRVLGQTTLGLFPATMDISADGSLLDLLEEYYTEFNQPIMADHLCFFLSQAASAIDFLNARQPRRFPGGQWLPRRP